MRRVGLLAVLAVPALITGCGASSPVATSVPRAAGAQSTKLGWVESAGSPQSRLVFRVRSFTVTDSGWSADVSVSNATAATFAVDGRNDLGDHAFGVMVFGTGAHVELERRNAQLALPELRQGTTFAPALPGLLGPHATWAGTVSAQGALPSGLWVRFVFGAFVPKGKMPDSLSREGVRDSLIWITDHAHRLR